MAAWSDTPYSVGSGKDYETLNTFEAATDDMTQGSTHLVAECYGDVTSGTVWFSGYGDYFDIDHKLIVRGAENEEPDGLTPGAGAAIDASFKPYTTNANDFYMDVHDIEFSGGSAQATIDKNGTYTFGNIYFTGQAATSVKISANVSAGALRFGSMVFESTSSTYDHPFSFLSDNANVTVDIYNFSSGEGIATTRCVYNANANNVVNVYNSASLGSDITDDWVLCDVVTNCLSEKDAELSITDGVDFTEPSTEDYRPVASGALDISGTAHPQWFLDITGGVDMQGTTWDATPSCGGFQVPSAGGGRIMSSLVASGGLAGSGGIAGQGGGLAA